MTIRTTAHPMTSATFDTTPTRFDYTGSLQEYIVPAGCKKLLVECVAAQGENGGRGGRVECILSVNPRQILYIWVGGYGSSANRYNASDVRLSNSGVTDTESLRSRLLVAGAGGASGQAQSLTGTGAAGGGLIGATGGATTRCTGGTGGTQNSGGTGANNGQFGLGGATTVNGNMRGGAGGSGWYGGGSGTTNHQSGHGYYAAGGGGGSSYTNPEYCSEVIHTQGYKTGAGYITLTPFKQKKEITH